MNSFCKTVSEWVIVTQSCLTLCNPMDCSLPGSSVHGILQARLLEWEMDKDDAQKKKTLMTDKHKVCNITISEKAKPITTENTVPSTHVWPFLNISIIRVELFWQVFLIPSTPGKCMAESPLFLQVDVCTGLLSQMVIVQPQLSNGLQKSCESEVSL